MVAAVAAIVITLMASAGSAWAAVRYVDLNSPSPAPPYTNWATAAHVIQDAVDAAAPGDQVLVTNGVYATGGRMVFSSITNRVAIDRAISVESVNGPEVTIIQGYQVPGTTNGTEAIRCAYLVNGASLSGFTLTNGATRSSAFGSDHFGGGVLCEELAIAVVSNCVLVGNSAFGGGGAACRGILSKCLLIGNSAGYGGGAFLSTLNNCLVAGNSAALSGGGANQCTLNNCTLISNRAQNAGGAYRGSLKNCTVVGNTGGGVSADEFRAGGLRNSIAYYNTPYNIGIYMVVDNSCTTPFYGAGNITNAPLFVDTNGWSNLRLKSNSPCINAGNNADVIGTTDLDGRPRIVGGTVDMGAYEFQGPGLSEFIGWLAQYGLPRDGSADYTDRDGDGWNNWQEWRSGTDPINAWSALKMLSPAPGSPGVVVSWESVSGIYYFLQRGSDLAAQPAFVTLQSNIVGQTTTTSFGDTNAVGPGPFFYRVGVQ